MSLEIGKKILLSNGYYYWGNVENGKPGLLGIIGKKYSDEVMLTHYLKDDKINSVSMVRESSGDCHLGVYSNGLGEGFFMDFGNRNLSFGLKLNDKWNGPKIMPDVYGKFAISFYNNGMPSGFMLVYKDNNLSFEFYRNGSCVKTVVLEKGIDIKHNYNFFDMTMAPFKYCENLYVHIDKTYCIARQGDKYHSKDGYGYAFFDDGEFALSEFKSGERTGMGCYKFANNDVFYGQFRENKVSGLGCYSKFDTDVFSYGLFDSSKTKYGVHFEYSLSPLKLNICKYKNGVKYGDSISLDCKTFDVTYYSESGNVRVHRFADIINF